jgi:hypothetical protein
MSPWQPIGTQPPILQRRRDGGFARRVQRIHRDVGGARGVAVREARPRPARAQAYPRARAGGAGDSSQSEAAGAGRGGCTVKPARSRAAGASWLPRRPRFQRRHVAPAQPIVFEAQVIGTDRRKRLRCGFRDAQGTYACAAPDIGAVTAWGGVTLAAGMVWIGRDWRMPPTRPRGQYGLAGRVSQLEAADLPAVVRCRDGHASRITAAVLTSVRTLMTMPT